MLFSRCAPKVHVPLVAGPWRRPRSISASRAVLTRTLATDSNYTCTRLRSSSTSNGAFDLKLFLSDLCILKLDLFLFVEVKTHQLKF